MRFEPNYNGFQEQLTDFPHHLFMLNKYGQTPLDIAIQETIDATNVQTSMRKSQDNTKIREAECEVENA